MSGENNPFYGKKHSPETRAKISERTSGPNHRDWNGGTGTLPYGPEFTRKFKRLLRERDDQTCQRCGITREQHGRTLEVHHIDADKMNNDPANLAAVCASCNQWCRWHPEPLLIPLNRR
jgi:hypothetical protein